MQAELKKTKQNKQTKKNSNNKITQQINVALGHSRVIGDIRYSTHTHTHTHTVCPGQMYGLS